VIIIKDVFIHDTAEVSKDANILDGTKIWNLAQIRENVSIGRNCVISKNVYIDHSVKIGDNVKVQNNVSIFFDAEIESGVFIGPHVCFTNDKFPRAINPDGTLKSGGSGTTDWEVLKTIVKKGASIGANSTILSGISIGSWSLIGAGSVVTKSVPNHALVIGCPARVAGYVCKCAKILDEENFFCKICKTTLEEVKK